MEGPTPIKINCNVEEVVNFNGKDELIKSIMKNGINMNTPNMNVEDKKERLPRAGFFFLSKEE